MPFLYPPGYYWVVALFGRGPTLHAAAHAVSVVSTMVQAVLVYRIARRVGASLTWSRLGVGLFFASFGYCAFWYDIERADSLFVAVLLLGTLVLMETDGLVGALLAGAIFGADYFVKQPALLFVGAGALALVVSNRARASAAFGAMGLTIIVGGTLWGNHVTGGWFSFYTVKMPAAHGITAALIPQFFQDLGQATLLLVATIVVAATVGRAVLGRKGDRVQIVFACMLLAAFAASASSRLHVGGFDNVLMFFSTFASIAVAIVGTWWSVEGPSTTLAVGFLLVVCQLMSFSFKPRKHVPAAVHAAAFEWLRATTRRFEQKGPVLVPEHGHITMERHAHSYALVDLFSMDERVRPGILAPIDERHFSAVITASDIPMVLRLEMVPPDDDDSSIHVVLRHVLESYYPADRSPFVSVQSACPEGYPHSIPLYVLEPRKEPLTTLSFEEKARRWTAELAELDLGPSPTGETVEARAKRALTAAMK